ncbi:hypothetical protein AB0885_42270, partial [Streptomyces sp. NPDC005534]
RHVSDEPAATLDALDAELQAHVGGRLHDDAALLLLRMPTVQSRAEQAPAVLTGAGSLTTVARSGPTAGSGVGCGVGAE